jgi:hypothetical protein
VDNYISMAETTDIEASTGFGAAPTILIALSERFQRTHTNGCRA